MGQPVAVGFRRELTEIVRARLHLVEYLSKPLSKTLRGWSNRLAPRFLHGEVDVSQLSEQCFALLLVQ
jgi:hypothetical protein